MKLTLLTFLLVLSGLTGCSQNSASYNPLRGKIPIDGKRWYQLNNAQQGLDALFDGNLQDKFSTTDGAVLKHYDAYYPILPGEQMTIDSIRFYDWEGSNEDQPMTIYAILDDWSKVQIAVFTGMRYNEWDGPDPSKPTIFALSKPISHIRYLIINSWGQFPGEIEFYGPYMPPSLVSKAVVKAAPLENFFGVNAFEWDFENPADPGRLDTARLAMMKNFTGFRHYMDWSKLEADEGSYAFNPTYNGGWNYDTIYQWCKQQHIEVLACLKTIPHWLEVTYPKDEQNDENIPMRYGKDPADPNSYTEQAKVAYQYAARYGRNKNIDPALIRLQHDNTIRAGLDYITYMECDNERDKWWKGRKAYQTGREYAANLSAFYDGNKKTMGPGVGVKNADPTMQVVMAGVALPTTDYLKGMIDWCKENRGYKPDGSVNLAWDVINYHFYANDASVDPSKKQTTGVAPEIAKADSFANEFIQVAHRECGDMPVWVTEAGYDLNPGSVQKAPATGAKPAAEVQADWMLRTSLLYARVGIQRVFYYELHDDAPGSDTRYATSGLVDNNGQRRPVADYFYQVNKLFGDCSYKQTLSKTPIVDKYTSNGATMYMLVMPTEDGSTSSYTLDLGDASYARICKPKAGSNDMDITKQQTNSGKIEITVTETSVFVTPLHVRD